MQKRFSSQYEDNRSILQRKKLFRVISASFLVKILMIGFSFILSVVLARVLGSKGYGEYSFCISMINLLTVPAVLGLPQLMVRELAIYKSKNQFEIIKGLLLRAGQSVFIMSCLLSCCLTAAYFFIWPAKKIVPDKVFCLAMLIVPALALVQIYGAALRGLGKIILGQIFDLIRQVGMVLVLVGSLYFIEKISVYHAVFFQLILIALALIITAWLLRNTLPYKNKDIPALYKSKEWFDSSWPLLIASGMQILNNEIPIIILGTFSNAEEIGFFRVAQRGAQLVSFGLMAVNITIGPTISKMYHNSELGRLQAVITKSARYTMVYSLPVALIFIVFSYQIITFIYGTEFIEAAFPLIILCFAQLFNASAGLVVLILNMTNNEKIAAIGVGISTFVSLILSVITIPALGATGAAFSMGTSLLIWNLILAICVYKKTGLKTTAFHRLGPRKK